MATLDDAAEPLVWDADPMDLLEVMRSTAAHREFTAEPVPDEVLYRVLDAARFAPSGGNRQGWRVVVVRDPSTKDAMVELIRPTIAVYLAQRAAGENPFNTVEPTSVDVAAVAADPPDAPWVRAMFEAAPVVVVVGVDLRVVAAFDIALDRVGLVGGASVYPFVWNLLLAARAEGLGGTITTFLAGREPEAQALLGFPPEVAIAAAVPLGHPVRHLTKLSRNPVESFTRLERWDGPPLSPGDRG